jgi:hypothetical protein
MSPRPLVALAVALLAALPAACAPSSGSSDSAGDFRGDQRAVATVVEDLEEAASDGDQAKICKDLLAPALADKLSAAGGGCADAVDNAIKNADTFAMDVQAVRVSGDRATARVKFETGDRDRTGTVGLSRPNATAGWRIAALPASR